MTIFLSIFHYPRLKAVIFFRKLIAKMINEEKKAEYVVGQIVR